MKTFELQAAQAQQFVLELWRQGADRGAYSYMAIGYLADGMESMENQKRPDGSLRTRDRGRQLPDGSVALTGRVGSVVVLAGRKADPRDIEAAIVAIEGVLAAKVVLEGSRYEPVVTAHVESAGLSEQSIRSRLAQILPSQAIPSRILLAENLPRSASGKVRAPLHCKETA